MPACSLCGELLGVEGDFVECSTCIRKLHFQCSSVTEKTWRTMGVKKDSWKCQFCRNIVTTAASNTGIVVSQKNLALDVQAAKRTRPINSPDAIRAASSNNDNGNQVVLGEIRQLREQLKEISSSCNFLSCKYDEISINMEKNNKLIEEFTKEMNDLKETNKKKDLIIENMKSQIQNIEQQMIKNNIDIKNIPQTSQENLI